MEAVVVVVQSLLVQFWMIWQPDSEDIDFYYGLFRGRYCTWKAPEASSFAVRVVGDRQWVVWGQGMRLP